MKIGQGVSELWRVENRPLALTWPMAYTTACTTEQAVTCRKNLTKRHIFHHTVAMISVMLRSLRRIY